MKKCLNYDQCPRIYIDVCLLLTTPSVWVVHLWFLCVVLFTTYDGGITVWTAFRLLTIKNERVVPVTLRVVGYRVPYMVNHEYTWPVERRSHRPMAANWGWESWMFVGRLVCGLFKVEKLHHRVSILSCSWIPPTVLLCYHFLNSCTLLNLKLCFVRFQCIYIKYLTFYVIFCNFGNLFLSLKRFL